MRASWRRFTFIIVGKSVRVGQLASEIISHRLFVSTFSQVSYCYVFGCQHTTLEVRTAAAAPAQLLLSRQFSSHAYHYLLFLLTTVTDILSIRDVEVGDASRLAISTVTSPTGNHGPTPSSSDHDVDSPPDSSALVATLHFSPSSSHSVPHFPSALS
jgi:hypothetical protein